MSDSMSLVATTANSQTGNATTASSVDGQPDDNASATGFSELLHASLNQSQQEQGDMPLMLIEGESLPVFATSETRDGNSLPQQPLVNWSVLMSWDEAAAEDMPQVQSQQLPGKAKTPLSLLNNQTVTDNHLKPAVPAAEMMDMNFTQMAQDNKLQAVNMQMLAQQKLQPAEQNLVTPSEMPLAGNQHNNIQNLNSIAALSSTAMQRADYTASTQISIAPQHPNWSQALGERMQWMIGQDIHKAELRLDPPELGSLEVQIKVNKEQATVTFSSANAQVRDAVESATVRLREMFAEAGLTLGDVNVSQESFSQQRDGDGNETGSLTAVADAETSGREGQEQSPVSVTKETMGLLDIYA